MFVEVDLVGLVGMGFNVWCRSGFGVGLVGWNGKERSAFPLLLSWRIGWRRISLVCTGVSMCSQMDNT